MTTDKRELVTTKIEDGPSLHGILTSLSVILPSSDDDRRSDSPFGFPNVFEVLLQPIEGWQKSTKTMRASVVITGMENIEYNYSDYVLTGYFKKSSRHTLCSLFELPTEKINRSVDTLGWLTFVAKYNVHKRKGEITIEYLEEKPWFVIRNCKRFD